MRCRHCGSDNIRHFKAIHAEGTTEVSVSASAKPVWNNQPFSVHGKQKLKGGAQLQTELAKRCSPPSDPQPWCYFWRLSPDYSWAATWGFRQAATGAVFGWECCAFLSPVLL